MITPMEIHNKEFKRKVRGYDQDEVDEFLDKIVVDYEKLYRENAELKDKINLQNEKMQHYVSLESTLQNTLVVAQKTSEDIENNARKKAENIVQEAHHQGKTIIAEANAEIINIMKKKEEMVKDVKIFKTRVSALITTQMELLNALDEETPLEETLNEVLEETESDS